MRRFASVLYLLLACSLALNVGYVHKSYQEAVRLDANRHADYELFLSMVQWLQLYADNPPPDTATPQEVALYLYHIRNCLLIAQAKLTDLEPILGVRYRVATGPLAQFLASADLQLNVKIVTVLNSPRPGQPLHLPYLLPHFQHMAAALDGTTLAEPAGIRAAFTTINDQLARLPPLE